MSSPGTWSFDNDSRWTSPSFGFIVEGETVYLRPRLVSWISTPLDRVMHQNGVEEIDDACAVLDNVTAATFHRFCRWAYSGSFMTATEKHAIGYSGPTDVSPPSLLSVAQLYVFADRWEIPDLVKDTVAYLRFRICIMRSEDLDKDTMDLIRYCYETSTGAAGDDSDLRSSMIGLFKRMMEKLLQNEEFQGVLAEVGEVRHEFFELVAQRLKGPDDRSGARSEYGPSHRTL